MIIHPDLRALRDDDSPQRIAQDMLVAQVSAWREQEHVAALLAAVKQFAKGGDLADQPALARLFDAGSDEALASTWITWHWPWIRLNFRTTGAGKGIRPSRTRPSGPRTMARASTSSSLDAKAAGPSRTRFPLARSATASIDSRQAGEGSAASMAAVPAPEPPDRPARDAPPSALPPAGAGVPAGGTCAPY